MSSAPTGVALTTTPFFEGRRIVRCAGIVTSEAILGANFLEDVSAGLRDFVGGRSATEQRELQQARDAALAELCTRAKGLGANAVVGVDLHYEVLGASGTAVVLE